MIDRYDMYNNGDDDGSDASKPKEQDNRNKIEFVRESVVIEIDGKKVTVVTREMYDRQTVELEKTKKQLRIMATEIQQLRRVMNNISKSMVESFRDRFD